MGRKVAYEIFNTVTGKWEESITDEEEVLKAYETYLLDYEAYEAEKDIINEIIRQRREEIRNQKD
tara:strand:+ start:256 stop:450 length:195 start_codon:yes stop_codon:yes gene_type:complete